MGLLDNLVMKIAGKDPENKVKGISVDKDGVINSKTVGDAREVLTNVSLPAQEEFISDPIEISHSATLINFRSSINMSAGVNISVEYLNRNDNVIGTVHEIYDHDGNITVRSDIFHVFRSNRFRFKILNKHTSDRWLRTLSIREIPAYIPKEVPNYTALKKRNELIGQETRTVQPNTTDILYGIDQIDLSDYVFVWVAVKASTGNNWSLRIQDWYIDGQEMQYESGGQTILTANGRNDSHSDWIDIAGDSARFRIRNNSGSEQEFTVSLFGVR